MSHDKQPPPVSAPAEFQHDAPADAPDPLSAFPTEAEVAATAARRAQRHRVAWLGPMVLAGGVVVAVLGVWLAVPGASAYVLSRLGFSVSSAQATLVIQTTPPGCEVTEGARRLGATPLKVSLAPGKHSFVLRNGSSLRPLEVMLERGVEVVHHLDLPAEAAAGMLHIATIPPGAAVEIDGVGSGTSPVDVAGLAPGNHSVTVRGGNRVVNERVTMAPGGTATLLVPLTPGEAAPASVGWVAIAAAIELQVYEGDSLVGSSRNQRIMLMPGRRTLRLENAALGFASTSAVTVEPGAVAKIAVRLPNGTLSVNAVPWAEVVLDGTVIGETPISNFSVPLGPHELVLRNPRFAEHRRTVVVSLTAPVRIGVDLRQ
jgi:hypothetical protein